MIYDLDLLPRKAAESLAQWVLSLSPGSPCFCCGSPLEASRTEGALELSASPEACVLKCPRCGAEASAHAAAAALPVPLGSERFGRRILVAA